MLGGLAPGRHTISLSGSSNAFDVTTVGGTISLPGYRVDQTITLNVAGVPEPASWVLLIAGFAYVAAGMRLRRWALGVTAGTRPPSPVERRGAETR